jgi:hypothetical protein
MHNKALDYATVRVAYATGISGGKTADEMNCDLRIGKGRILRRIARYGLLGAAVAVLPCS